MLSVSGDSYDFVNKLLIKAKARGTTTKLIQTDNGHEFQEKFRNHLTSLGIKHQYIWIRTPDQNVVVERSHRTDEEEFYLETEIDYTNLDNTNQKIKVWLEYYNTKRPRFRLSTQ